MAHKRWVMIDFDNCPDCGDCPEVLTTGEDGMFYDGDEVRCAAECGMTGHMSCDEGEAWVSWNEEDL